METAPTLEDAIQTFLDDLELEGRSPATVRTYGYGLRWMARWWAQDGRDCPYLTDLDGRAVRAILRDYGRSHAPNSLNTLYGAICAFLSHAVEVGWLPISPMRGIRPPRVPRKPHVYLSPAELRRVYEVAEQRVPHQPQAKRDELLLILRLLMQGLRVGELCALRWQDVDWEGYVTVRGKGDRWRVVPVDDVALEMLRASRSVDKVIPLTTDAVRLRIAALGRRAGVRLHPHMFRKSWASNALEAGEAIPTVQEVGGWSSAEMLRTTYARSIYQKAAARRMRRNDVLE